MSLEQAINENTAVLRELIATMLKGGQHPIGAAVLTKAADEIEKAEKPAAEKKAKPEAKKQPAAETASSPNGATPETTDQADAAQGNAAPTYDTVKAKILELSKEKGREPTVALMQRYGVAKGPDLKENQYADFIKDVDAILAGEYNPLDAELA